MTSSTSPRSPGPNPELFLLDERGGAATATSSEGISPSVIRLRKDPSAETPPSSLAQRRLESLAARPLLTLCLTPDPDCGYQQPRGKVPGLQVQACTDTQQPLLDRIHELLMTGTGHIGEGLGGSGYSLGIYDEADQLVALFKSKERELGTEFDQSASKNAHITSKEGILPGQGARREHLAMLYTRSFLERAGVSPQELDVPDTAYVTCSSEQLHRPDLSGDEPYLVAEEGAMVSFEQHCTPCTRDSVPLFQALPHRLIQLVAILDIILMNADRNGGNLLLQNGERLLLIDHAAILPAQGASSLQCTYLEWEALKQPLDRETKQLVASLSTQQLEGILAAEGVDAGEFMGVHSLALTVLQEGLSLGLSLYEIAILFSSTDSLDTARNIVAYFSSNPPQTIEQFLKDYKARIRAPSSIDSPPLTQKEICIFAKHALIPAGTLA